MEVGFLIKCLNPIIECQHLFLFVLSFGFNSCIWIFRHFQWVLEFAFNDSSQSFSTWKLGYASAIQKIKQNKIHFLVCASSLFCHFLIATLSHNRVTHWMESPEHLIFFLKSLFPSETLQRCVSAHFRHCCSVEECGEEGQRCTHNGWLCATTVETMRLSKAQNNRAGPCATRRAVLRTVPCSRTFKWSFLVWKQGCFVRLFIKASTQQMPLSFLLIPEELLIPLFACCFHSDLGKYHFLSPKRCVIGLTWVRKTCAFCRLFHFQCTCGQDPWGLVTHYWEQSESLEHKSEMGETHL